MQIKLKVIAAMALLTSVSLLAGCATKGGHGGSLDNKDYGNNDNAVWSKAGPANSGAASTYAMQSGAGFQGTNNANGVSTVAANQTYYFQFDSNKLEQKDYASLDQQANYLVAHPAEQVALQGNTDSRGSREYNIALGWRRAQAVAQALEQRGVPSKQLTLVSYGKEHPAVTGSTEQAYALNRRTNLVYPQQQQS